MTSYDDLKDVADEKGDATDSIGKTTLKLDGQVISDLKQDFNVSKNKDIAPLVSSIVAEFLEQSEVAEELREEFKTVYED